MSKKKSRILVLGNFGYANHNLNGQTIKTRVSREMIEKYHGSDNTDYFDTQTLENKLKIFTLLKKVCSADIVFYLPARGNLKYLLPVYFVLSKIFRFKIIYSVIGGWLVPYLKNKPLHRWMLKRIKVVLAETELMKNELAQEYGFKNVDVLYNFRLSDFNPTIHNHETLKLVFMARIHPLKGLNTIFALCEYIASMSPKPDITVDFYGQLAPGITDQEFIDQVNKYSFVTYHGALEPEDINETIHDYDLMMLPTQYFTEGLPGTIIDAYTSGLPAIVTKWRHATEFIDNWNNGIIVPFDNNQEDFITAIIDLYKNRSMLNKLKIGAIKSGKQFTGEYAWEVVKKYV
ncbi:MAG: glycosyltransferase family 4 protein [Bacteroides sp.]|nr:glycosyltransferase family 4 protein [Bacteroides sp.]